MLLVSDSESTFQITIIKTGILQKTLDLKLKELCLNPKSSEKNEVSTIWEKPPEEVASKLSSLGCTELGQART